MNNGNCMKCGGVHYGSGFRGGYTDEQVAAIWQYDIDHACLCGFECASR